MSAAISGMTNKLSLDRRRFLQIAGGTVAISALSSSVARAAQIAPATRTGTIRDIEHIVVLMQENRSFDHYFGSLRGVRGFGDPHPVIQPSGQPVWNQSGVLPFRPAPPAGSSEQTPAHPPRCSRAPEPPPPMLPPAARCRTTAP